MRHFAAPVNYVVLCLVVRIANAIHLIALAHCLVVLVLLNAVVARQTAALAVSCQLLLAVIAGALNQTVLAVFLSADAVYPTALAASPTAVAVYVLVQNALGFLVVG